MTQHVQALVQAFAPVVRNYITRALDGIVERLAALEARPAPERGERGEPGERGERGDPGPIGADGSPGIGERGEKGDAGDRGEPGADGAEGIAGPEGPEGPAGAAGEKGDRGDPGADGTGVTDLRVDDDVLVVALSDGREIRSGNVRGAPGRDGEQGPPGESVAGPPGERGADGAGVSDIRVDDEGHLVVALSTGGEIRTGRVKGMDGRDGAPGPPGEATQGAPGERGADGRDGADGRSVISAALQEGVLVLSFSDGETRDLGMIVGQQGVPGRDGLDGKDVDPTVVAALVRTEVEKATEASFARITARKSISDQEFATRVSLALGRTVEIGAQGERDAG
jgi:hypothetical protein